MPGIVWKVWYGHGGSSPNTSAEKRATRRTRIEAEVKERDVAILDEMACCVDEEAQRR